jgi:hypothetical protein
MNDYVFSALQKYGSGAEENYLTESFVFLLKLLLKRDTSIGLRVINEVSGLPPRLMFNAQNSVAILTQVTGTEGRPDIEIRQNDTLVYIEVKHDSSLGLGQLEAYRTQLQKIDDSNTHLVLLTRSRASSSETTLSPTEFHHICWYEIYNLLANSQSRDEVCQYFIHSFLHFLEEKKMSMTKVTWNYIEGVPALLFLTQMMEVSITEAGNHSRFRRTAGWSWRGFYMGEFFYGLRYEQPLSIVFENNLGTNPTYRRVLSLEEIHFFSLTKDQQFETLIMFLKAAYNDAPSRAASIDPDELPLELDNPGPDQF